MPLALALSDRASLRAQVASASASPFNPDKESTAGGDLSLGDFPANLHGFRRCFPDRWASFLRAHFQGATHVAAFFDVDHATARAWLSGKHGATAPVALYAIQRIPGALAMLLEDAA